MKKEKNIKVTKKVSNKTDQKEIKKVPEIETQKPSVFEMSGSDRSKIKARRSRSKKGISSAWDPTRKGSRYENKYK